MTTHRLEVDGGTITIDDMGGEGPVMIMLPGAGDIRSEYRFLAPLISAAGWRVVTMDLRGHGDSSPDWPSYRVADTASDLVQVLDHLGAGPATVVATSFAPAAALWAAAERPDLIDRLVLIAAHLETSRAHERLLLSLAMRGPIAAKIWAGQFQKWHPGAPPADLTDHTDKLATMLADPRRRRAVRETLIARRDGLDERMAAVDASVLVVMGADDSHFKDPVAEADSIAEHTGGRVVLVPDAGHYPHVEFPDAVADAVLAFAGDTAS